MSRNKPTSIVSWAGPVELVRLLRFWSDQSGWFQTPSNLITQN